MPPRQLELFPAINPLKQLFPREFFRQAPRQSGVYIMGGEQEKILYVGKAKNLRQRLGSYRYAHRGASSKTSRLLKAVRTITWELYSSEEEALLRENQLLRLHKPRFNAVNTRPEFYPFVAMQKSPAKVLLRLTTCGVALPNELLFGAFKGIYRTRAAFAGLARSLWAFERGALWPEFPSRLIRARGPDRIMLDLDRPAPLRDLVPALETFFAGRSDELIRWFSENLLTRPGLSAFQRKLHETDLENLAAFYRVGAQRNFRLQSQLDLADATISQNEIDDLLVVATHVPNLAP